VTELERLEQENKELRDKLKEQQKTCDLLKKRLVRSTPQNTPSQQAKDRGLFIPAEEKVDPGSKVKSVFLENVSHEIRSSMTGIIGMTDLMLETDLSQEQRMYLEMVSQSVDRLLVVVNEVMDFSKIEAGELVLEPEDFNIKESLDNDLYLLSLAAQTKGLSLSCKISPEVPAHLNGDSNRLNQILTNLINNAIKFTDGGEVQLAIENDGFDSDNNLLIRFEVSDTGKGIDAGTLEQINGYFSQQADITLPLALGTTGLGLTVSSQLVKIMGGEISASSEPGHTVFAFTLPFKEVADLGGFEKKTTKALEEIEENVTYGLQGVKVLLADDDYINRVLIETILKQAGMEVTAVDNGHDAVDRGCSGDYRIMLLDVQMEDMDGIEATKRIRKFEKVNGGHLDIIALTALVMPGDREKCLQAGMDDYLPKPVERKRLIDLIVKFITRRALVVDSDPVSQNALVRGLVEQGWRVTIAETSRSAMYEVALSVFDLIVLDVDSSQQESKKMVTLLRQLEEYSGRRAHIVALGENEQQARESATGYDSFMNRPVTREQLVKVVSSFS